MNRPQEIDILTRYSGYLISTMTDELSTVAEQLDSWTEELLQTDDDLLLDGVSAANVLLIKAIKQLKRAASILREE
jgi:hypothetical protein